MVGGRLVVEQAAIGDGDDAGIGIDGEAPAGVVAEGVAHRVGAVAIAGQRRDAHGGAVGGVLGDRVGGAIGVADRADVVDDGDRLGGRGDRFGAIGGAGLI